MRRIGVDVGGTFTDLIYIDDEAQKVIVHKTPSTPADPSIGTVQGIEELCRMAGVEPSQLDQVFHGTTVATNIVIEHNGAKVGMITTKGYRDILHIARHKKPMNFSLWQNLPWQAFPIVRRRFRLTVDERIDKDGNILIPLDEDEVRAQLGRIFRTDTASWALVARQVSQASWPVARPPLLNGREVDLGDGVFVAGDHRESPGIGGAIRSGRRAALAVRELLGEPAER